MRGLFQRFTLFLRTLFFKNVKGENRLILNFTGLFIIAILHFFVSVGIFIYAYSFIVSNDNRLENDLKLTYSIKNDLAILSSGNDLSVQVLKRLENSANLVSKKTKKEQSWRLVETSLSNLVKVMSDSKSGLNHELDDELVNSGVIIDNLIRLLIEKRQTVNDKLLSRAFIYEMGSILLTIILVCIGVIPLIKSIKKRNAEIAYFESLAYQFKSGQLDKIDLTYPGENLTDLNEALLKFIQLIRERYQSVKDQIKSLNFQANEIVLFSNQGNTFYSEIRQDLEKLVAHTYSQVDKYQVLVGRIKSLNDNLEDSQQQVLVFHESLKSWARVFQEAPETIRAIEIQVNKREQYLKKIVGDLNQLRSTLDQLLQTGSVFQSVAEQNTLLALNASIEAARAETAAGGFDIAAEEIAHLAEKVGRVSKELLAIVDLMGFKGNTALKTLEIDLVRNNDVKHYIEAVDNKINLFCQKLSQLLEEAIQYSTQIEELEDKRKSLEKLAHSLGDLDQQSQNYYGRAEAAIKVIKKSGETMAATEELNSLISELKQLMNKIVI